MWVGTYEDVSTSGEWIAYNHDQFVSCVDLLTELYELDVSKSMNIKSLPLNVQFIRQKLKHPRRLGSQIGSCSRCSEKKQNISVTLCQNVFASSFWRCSRPRTHFQSGISLGKAVCETLSTDHQNQILLKQFEKIVQQNTKGDVSQRMYSRTQLKLQKRLFQAHNRLHANSTEQICYKQEVH